MLGPDLTQASGPQMGPHHALPPCSLWWPWASWALRPGITAALTRAHCWPASWRMGLPGAAPCSFARKREDLQPSSSTSLSGFSTCGPRTTAPWDPVRKAESRAPSHILWIRTSFSSKPLGEWQEQHPLRPETTWELGAPQRATGLPTLRTVSAGPVATPLVHFV